MRRLFPGIPTRIALALTAVWAWGCGVAPERVPPPPPPSLADDEVLVRTVLDGDRTVLELLSRAGSAARPTVVARVRGVTLVLANRPDERMLLPFAKPAADQARDAVDLTLSCTGERDHAVVVRARLSAPGEVHVTVDDRVGLRSDILELSVEYRFLAATPVDEWEAPHLHPGPDQAAGDSAFRSPVAYLRSGRLALAVLPDLAALERDRRIAQAVEVSGVDTPWIRHGLYRLRAAQSDDLQVLTRAGAEPASLRGETVGFAHTVFVSDRAAPNATLAELHGKLWARHAAPVLARSAAPIDDSTWEELCAPTFARLERGTYREFRYAGELVATLADDPAGSAETTWLTDRRHVLHAAWGLALRAVRTGDPELLARVERIVALVLAAPRRGGLFPAVFRRDPRADHGTWQAGPDGGPFDVHAYYLLDSAATGTWLLRLSVHLPGRRAAILEACGELGRFLVRNQATDGSVPPLYEGEHLRPVRELPRGGEAETAGAALFLAELTARTGDPVSRAAAESAFDYVRDVVASRAAWTDRATPEPDAGAVVDPSRSAPRSALCTILAAQAAFALGRSGAALPVVAQLGHHQQVWPPSWLPGVPLGGIDDRDTDVRFEAESVALGAQALLDGYLSSGRRELLQRGSAALRSGLIGDREPVYGSADTSAATTEWVRSVLGQGVVDVAGRFAEGLDGLWFEDLEVGADRIGFRLLTHAEFDGPVTIMFRRLPAASYRLVVNGEEAGSFARGQLQNGLPLRPRRVARFEFRPPSRLRVDSSWRPRATFDGPFVTDSDVHVEVSSGRRSARIKLWPAEEPGVLLADEGDPFGTVGLAPGDELQVRLVCVEDGRLTQTPTQGLRTIVVGTMDCVDPGDDDERTLVEEFGTRIGRFLDGREWARIASGAGSWFRHALEVDRRAETIDLRIRLTGALRLHNREILIHEDSPETPDGIRSVELRLADPRLWSDGTLDLKLEPTAPDRPLSVARIEYLARGRTATVTENVGPGVVRHEPDPRIRVLIVPVDFADAECRSTNEELTQVFFGGPEYRVTPEPNSMVTTGSVATLFGVLSGGISGLDGSIAENEQVDLTVTDLTDDPEHAMRAVVGAVAPRLRITLLRDEFDAVVLLHAPGALPPQATGASLRCGLDGAPEDDGLPFVLLPERSAEDGSMLSCGRSAGALLRAMYGLGRLDTADSGNFGILTLTADGSGHVPTGLCGVQLIETGWADLVEIRGSDWAGASKSSILDFTTLLRGRQAYRIAFRELPHRGELWLEARDEPGLEQPGVLLYWRFDSARPQLLRLDGSSVRPELLRLSPTTSTFETPYRRGISADLFRAAMRLDGTSMPGLATLQGEVLWSIRNLSIDDRGNARCELAYRGVDLLDREITWFTGRNGRFGPLAGHDGGAELGTVADTGRGLSIDPGTQPGRTLRGRLLVRASDGPRRLFGRLSGLEGDGTGTLRVWLGNDVVLTARVDSTLGACLFQVELPHRDFDDALFLDLVAEHGHVRGVLDRLLLVPMSPALHEVSLPTDARSDGHLMDGIDYGRIHGFRLNHDGAARLSIPVYVPAGNTALRLHAGLGAGPEPDRVVATARLRSIDGSWRATIVDGLPIERRTRFAPLTLAIADIPASGKPRAAILNLELSGRPNTTLYLVSLAIVRR